MSTMRIVHIDVQSASLYLDAITINNCFNEIYFLAKEILFFFSSGPQQQFVKVTPYCA